MQNYNTDSLNTLPQNKDEADHLSPLEKKTAPIELTIDESFVVNVGSNQSQIAFKQACVGKVLKLSRNLKVPTQDRSALLRLA